MANRRGLGKLLLGPAAVVIGLGVGPLVGTASATTPTVTLSPAPVGGPPGTLQNDQTITVSVGPNSTFTPGAGISILECADPGGSPSNLPSDETTCDGNTINNDSIIVGSDGSFSYGAYVIYALPSAALGEGSSGEPKCDATDACVLYVGQNQGDFSAPKVFSAPFFVGAPASTPESPLTIALPIGGAAILGLGGAVAYRRRSRKNVGDAPA